MAFLKINGFHTISGNGSYNQTRLFMEACEDAGVPFTAYCVDGTVSVYDAQEIVRGSVVPHNIIFRRNKFPHTQSGDSAPDYSLSPQRVAEQHWLSHVKQWPKELDPSLVWGETANEWRKELEWANWIGEFCYYTAQFALKAGWKWIGPGYASGTPEEGSWEQPWMIKFLKLCADYPEQLGVALHEYSYTIDNIHNMEPFLIGRFQQLYASCDKLGIARPTTFITEWGWEERNVPSLERGMQDIIEIGALYAKYPTLKGAVIWTLGANWGGIDQKLANYVEPLADALATVRYPDPDPKPPPDPPPSDKPKKVIFKWAQEHTESERDSVWIEAKKEYFRTVTGSHDDMRDMVAAGDPSTSKGVIFDSWLPSQQQAIAAMEAANLKYEVRVLRPRDPYQMLEGLKFGYLFNVPYTLTSKFGVQRDYGRHEGSDYDVLSILPDSKESVLCVYPGKVRYIRPNPDGSKAYGNYVLVDHEYNGHRFATWYCHLDKIYVEAGATLKAGDIVGEIGATGNVTGEHLHLNMQVFFLDINTEWVLTNVIDPDRFFPMHTGVPMTPIYPQSKIYDLLAYMRGDGRKYRVRTVQGPNKGAEEIFQTQRGAENQFFYVKNEQWEELFFTPDRIYRRRDTSPGPAPEEAERAFAYRWYEQFDPGSSIGAAWAKRFMRIGETFIGGIHQVQFYYKEDCAESALNSGAARNTLTLTAHHDVWTSPAGKVMYDVIELSTPGTGESQFYAKGYGPVGWRMLSPAQASGIVEDVGGSNLVRERGCFSP